jgi:8-oxo-dGTP pyrophosphatase MutT (NUDIX family)
MFLSENKINSQLHKSYNPSIRPESPYPQKFFQKKLLHAAVLIPFLIQDHEWRLLYIRRTAQKNDRHGGQVAFPGGRCDPGDPDAEGAALREAYEETGIAPHDVKILGRIQDLVTITGYQVTPIVGTIPWPYNLILQPDEVYKTFTIPLLWLANPKNREVRNREFLIKGNSVPVIYFKPYDGEILWGASARITMLLLEVLGFSKPEKRYS